ncbi:12720_t:CDS:2 [Funneliformis geosporum]|uniref:12720_t:CDS:1 n=1 Tax=Funneliformis geosporum TaxID=1117311 RepID=A0A9W4SAP4_9GLOM|nr:12720_t:CDS:2 [Funneliformis geosporum]
MDSSEQSTLREQTSGKLSKEGISYKFWQEFQQEREEIQNSINDLSTKPKSSIPKLCEEILVRINTLERKATDATIYLPGYDQRQLILVPLVRELNTKRSEVAPKSKFTFKSRKPAFTNGSEEKVINTEERNTSTTIISNNTSSIFNENFQIVTLNDKQNSYLTINSYLSPPNDSKKIIDFHISNLQHCFINLVCTNVIIGAIHIKGLKDCVIISGPVGSSILINDCENCVLVVACHQFRMHTSKQMNIYLHVTSYPIIEDCNIIKFAPYTLSIPGLDKMFEAAKLDPNNNKYNKVEDFNWLRQQASPNWNLLDEKCLRKDWPLISGDERERAVSEDELKNTLNKILENK